MPSGAAVAKRPQQISVLARGASLAAIRENGIVVHAPRSEMHARVRASDDPGELGPQDAVIVTVKAPALPAVARRIGPLLRRDTPVVFAMNGIPWWYFHGHGGPDGQRLPQIDPAVRCGTPLGPHRALAGIVFCACDLVSPGVVHVETARGRLILGEPDGAVIPAGRGAGRADAVRGFQVQVFDRIRRVIWRAAANMVTGFSAAGPTTPKDLL